MSTGVQRTAGKKHPPSFMLSRVITAAATGTIGGGVGGVLGFFGGSTLDQRLRYPLGQSGDFLRIGNLTSLMAPLGLFVGVWLMVLAGHRMRGGRGGIGWGLAWTFLGAALMVAVCVWNTAITAPALLLPPMATALGLELTAMEREDSGIPK